VIVTAGFQADSRTLHKTLQARCLRGGVPACVGQSVASPLKTASAYTAQLCANQVILPVVHPLYISLLRLHENLLYWHGHDLG